MPCSIIFAGGFTGISVRRGCGLLMQSRTVYHWRDPPVDRAITLCIRESAETRYTAARVFIGSVARRKRWPVNHKKPAPDLLLS
ncbi:hypothetical protein KCP78_23100 [Salmonella enterica subsp. enterica]|nr:hypothetical protein KCP78_23100 [Salmonella enterica subsp. enterica]